MFVVVGLRVCWCCCLFWIDSLNCRLLLGLGGNAAVLICFGMSLMWVVCVSGRY